MAPSRHKQGGAAIIHGSTGEAFGSAIGPGRDRFSSVG